MNTVAKQVVIDSKELENKMSKVYNMLLLLENLLVEHNITATDVFGETETEDNRVQSQTGFIGTTEFMEYFKQYGIDVE